ncbi:MAG TPA: hypothetical protein VHY37_06180 [Tepidisphaeraceae bacterium]|jgi:hypothetical protein|nr:hypothetical protein [Tepidisphaeraceae bacterium]
MRPVQQITERIAAISFPQLYVPQHFLYFLPLPQGEGALRPIFADAPAIGSPGNLLASCPLFA